MKSYEEVTNNLLERRDRYVVEQNRKRKRMMGAATSLCCCCLVALIGFGVWQSGMLQSEPPIILDSSVGGDNAEDTTSCKDTDNNIVNPLDNTLLNTSEDTTPREDTDGKNTIVPPTLTYEILVSNDYAIPTDLISMMKSVDVVVEGTYDGTVSTYVTEIGQIVTVGKLSNLTFLKGSGPDNINISFYGGAITVSQYMEMVSSTQSSKHGFDKLTKEEADERYIGTPIYEYSANPQEGMKYLVLLSYDASIDEYFVACDGYGLREINNEGKAWNIDTSKYEDIPEIK